MVAERLGFERPTALTRGQAVAGLSAYAKGVSLGIFEPKPDLVREQGDRLAEGEQLHVDLLGRAVPAVRTPAGLALAYRPQPIRGPYDRHGAVEQVYMQLLILPPADHPARGPGRAWAR